MVSKTRVVDTILTLTWNVNRKGVRCSGTPILDGCYAVSQSRKLQSIIAPAQFRLPTITQIRQVKASKHNQMMMLGPVIGNNSHLSHSGSPFLIGASSHSQDTMYILNWQYTYSLITTKKVFARSDLKELKGLITFFFLGKYYSERRKKDRN